MNETDHILSPEQTELLALGLNYIPLVNSTGSQRDAELSSLKSNLSNYIAQVAQGKLNLPTEYNGNEGYIPREILERQNNQQFHSDENQGIRDAAFFFIVPIVICISNI